MKHSGKLLVGGTVFPLHARVSGVHQGDCIIVSPFIVQDLFHPDITVFPIIMLVNTLSEKLFRLLFRQSIMQIIQILHQIIYSLLDICLFLIQGDSHHGSPVRGPDIDQKQKQKQNSLCRSYHN